MALRVCSFAARKSGLLSANVVISGSPCLKAGGDALHTGCRPVCCPASKLLLTKLRSSQRRHTPHCQTVSVGFASSDAPVKNLLRRRALEMQSGPALAAVPPHEAEHTSLLMEDPDQPEDAKVLRVALIGSPNAGKSTLSNQLLGQKVFPVSQKVHTTRSRAQGVLTVDNTQIILLDTPGITTPFKVKRHQLEKSLLVDPWCSVRDADLVLVLVDVSDKWTRSTLNAQVVKCLAENPNIPAVLILNKVDLLKNKSLLLDITTGLTEGIVNGKRARIQKSKPTSESRGADVAMTSDVHKQHRLTGCDGQSSASPTENGHNEVEVQQLTNRHGWPHFRDVFMLSAVDSEEVEALKRYLVMEAKPGPWHYHSGVVTDQTPQEICTNAVREKVLEYLPQEVPYSVSQTVEMWHETESGELEILMKLHVKKESHMKMLIGQAGQMIARIAHEASQDLMNVFGCEVKLRLSVKMHK